MPSLFPPGPNAASLPLPDTDALAHSARLADTIRREIEQAGGRIPFDRYMDLALYAPGLGYYSAGSPKLGPEGDFVTAPEISPLFGRCVAAQCQQVLAVLAGSDILELGAGSGRLACDLLTELEALGTLPRRYLILEVSPDLRQQQRLALQGLAPKLRQRVRWLNGLPRGFRGVMVANEVLDAMPVHRFRIGVRGAEEEYVKASGEGFASCYGEVSSPGLAAALNEIQALGGKLPEGYVSEISGRAGPWVRALADSVAEGVVLLIDYGLSRGEYYHPQRSAGTLLCHYRHRVHADPFWLPGLQDITADVDFTAVAEAAVGADLRVEGFTTQAYFLFACGLDAAVAASDPEDAASHLALTQAVKRLTLPGEMGERFKVLALGRNWREPLRGFALRDLRERL